MSHKTDATLRPFFICFFTLCAFSPRKYESILRGFRLLCKLYLLRKLYFDFVKVIFRLSAEVIFWLSPKLRYLSITCPKGKYHAAGISLRKQYHAAGISLPLGLSRRRCIAFPGGKNIVSSLIILFLLYINIFIII